MKNKKGWAQYLAYLIIVLILIFAISEVKISGYSVFGENYKSDKFIHELSELEIMDFNSVKSFEEYQKFADNMNLMVDMLNDKFNLKINTFEPTREGWSKLSKTVTKYGPLIGNYNEIVHSSKNHEIYHTKESYSKSYVKIRSFAFEFAILSATSVHKLTFATVGKVFGKVDIGKIALKNPKLAASMMSGTYWSLKSYIVEESSGMIDWIAELADDKLNIDIREK